MALRQVEDADRGGVGRPVAEPVPRGAQETLGVHGALGRAGAAGGVDEQGERVLTRGSGEQGRGRQGAAPVDQLGQGVDGDRAPGPGQALPGRRQGLARAGGSRAVVEDDEAPDRARRDDHVDGGVQAVGARGQHRRLGLRDDRRQLGQRGVGLQGYGHGPQVDARQVERRVVGAGEAEGADPVAGAQGVLRVVVPPAGQRADAGPQFAVADGVEAREETPGRRVPGAFAEGGPVPVALQDGRHDLGERPARVDGGQGLGKPLARIVRRRGGGVQRFGHGGSSGGGSVVGRCGVGGAIRGGRGGSRVRRPGGQPRGGADVTSGPGARPRRG